MLEENEITRLEVEYLILADGAQVQNGKLYVLGGGWDRIQFPSYPQTVQGALVLGVRVPWGEANRKHTFEISGRTADAHEELFKAEGGFEVGRPPGTPEGMPQMFQVAMQLRINVPAPGTYEVVARIDGDKAIRRRPFFAVQLPQ
jgi:hypothetical protein